MTLKQEIWQHALVDSASNPDDFVRGAQWMYEKMMKNAIHGEICHGYGKSKMPIIKPSFFTSDWGKVGG